MASSDAPQEQPFNLKKTKQKKTMYQFSFQDNMMINNLKAD